MALSIGRLWNCTTPLLLRCEQVLNKQHNTDGWSHGFVLHITKLTVDTRYKKNIERPDINSH